MNKEKEGIKQMQGGKGADAKAQQREWQGLAAVDQAKYFFYGSSSRISDEEHDARTGAVDPRVNSR